MTFFDIDRTATAIGRSEIDISAPLPVVWSILTDIENWPAWNGGVEWVGGVPDLVPGTAFEWRAGGLTIRSILQAVDEPHMIGWTGKAPFIRSRHVAHLTPVRSCTRVELAESYRGAYARLLPSQAQRTIATALERTLRDLKATCEALGGAVVSPENAVARVIGTAAPRDLLETIVGPNCSPGRLPAAG